MACAPDSSVIQAWSHELIAQLRRSTIPVYKGSKDGPVVVGSAVLLAREDRRLLLTAAHVFRSNRDKPLGVGGDREIVQLGGEYHRTALVGGSTGRDRLDIALAELDERQIASRRPTSTRGPFRRLRRYTFV